MTTLRGDGLGAIVRARLVLLDFDGPLADVFAGHPSPLVAARLVESLRSTGNLLPPRVENESDPLAVLRWAADICDVDTLQRLDDELIAEELLAVDSAAPTPGGLHVARDAASRGQRVAVVSNNSVQAVGRFLSRFAAGDLFNHVTGRPYGRPQVMKPSPYPIESTLEILNAAPAECLLVGDSLTDLQAGLAAGVPVVLLANKHRKRDAFCSSRAVSVVTDMRDLLGP